MDDDSKQQLQKITELTARLQNSLPKYNPEVLWLLRRIQEACRPYSELAAQLAETAQRFAGTYSPLVDRLAQLTPSFPQLLVNIERLREEQQSNFALLANNGWYPDFSSLSLGELFDQTNRYAELYGTTGRPTADQSLTKHFELVMQNFSAHTSEDFPADRLAIIQDAIGAHAEGKYNLSTPIFLMQADGYANDMHNSPIWGLKQGQQGLLSKVKKKSDRDTFLSALIEPLLNRDQPILASKKQRAELVNSDHIVNRHAVLHGEATNYGTRENSARAFAFMWYCMFFMDTFFEDEPSSQVLAP